MQQLLAGERHGTLFAPGERLASRKHWLAFTAKSRGRLIVDDGAERALVDRGRSLLPAGVTRVEGSFQIGDPIGCVNARGDEIARGLAAYSAEDVARIAGRPTREIARVLGYSNGSDVIHRDDLVLLDAPNDSAGTEPKRSK